MKFNYKIFIFVITFVLFTIVPDVYALDFPAPCENPSGHYEGFGQNTTGGAGKSVYHVTNLNDSGSGSFRDALSGGNRCVVFDVGGIINLSSQLNIKNNLTLDGHTAPSPGITIKGGGSVSALSLVGVDNVIIRGIRIRDTVQSADGITVYNSHNVVVDHVSVSGFGDGAVDITEGSYDVTFSWSMLGSGNPSHNFMNLNGYHSHNISVHHNLYYNGQSRTPMCGYWDDDVTTGNPSETVCDIRNNVIWNNASVSWWEGTYLRTYANVNLIGNYYYSVSDSSNSVKLGNGVRFYTSGNYSKNGANVGGGNRTAPFSAASVATQDVMTAASLVMSRSGARGPAFGLDSLDQGYISGVPIESGNLDPSYTPTPTMTSEKQGDANGDGKVDGVDYIVWLNHYSQNISGVENGNFDGQNGIDGIDYIVWLNNYES